MNTFTVIYSFQNRVAIKILYYLDKCRTLYLNITRVKILIYSCLEGLIVLLQKSYILLKFFDTNK